LGLIYHTSLGWTDEVLLVRFEFTYTVPSEVLLDVCEAKRKATRPSLVYCGDDESSKAVAAELIRDVGFDPGTSKRYCQP